MFEIIILILAALGASIWFFGRQPFTPPKTVPSDQRTYKHFEAAPSLFVNRAEMNLFRELTRHVPKGYHVLSKVRLEDIIGVKASVKDPQAHWKLRARVKSRHVDFLIIDDIGTARAAIELDGASHDGTETFHADSLKNGLFKSANIPLHRINDTDDFKARVFALFASL